MKDRCFDLKLRQPGYTILQLTIYELIRDKFSYFYRLKKERHLVHIVSSKLIALRRIFHCVQDHKLDGLINFPSLLLLIGQSHPTSR